MYDDDTQPKAPTDMSSPPPDTSPPFMNIMMMMGVIIMTSCLCIAIVGLSGVAGIRDELDTLGTQAVATLESDLATQYALGNADLAAERYEMAAIRFAYLATKMPGYLDSAQQLALAQKASAQTPTPSRPAATATSQPMLQTTEPSAGTATATVDPLQLDPAELFGQAETAMNAGLYEEAIEWFDALVLVNPNYRRGEVRELRQKALIEQGLIYLRGRNQDGQDRLAQGVQLIYRADELGDVPGEVLYEADFVARYLSARAYVEGGAYGQAREVLTQLCDEDCDWSYQGVSVRTLLAQAGGS